MNKKLIALAVAGACVAPAAFAQSADPVTLYGRVHATFESVSTKQQNGSAAGLPNRLRVSDQASLLGVRGTEDLGGGLKAFFQLETAFKPDQNDSTFAGRNSGIGLQGGFGSIMMGRWDTPFKTATTTVDPFGDVTLGGTTAAMNDRTNFDRRETNVVQYWTPTMGGFAVKALYAANEGKTATVNPYTTSFSATFNRGAAYAFITYEEHKDQINTNGRSATVTSGVQEKGTAVGGTFAIGPVKLGGMYEEFKKTNLTTQKSWMANLVWTMGKHQLIYQHQDSKDGLASSAAVQPKCEVDSAGYQLNFSKRTFFLAQYSVTNNKSSTGTCGFGGNNLGSAGQKIEGTSLGLRHVF